VLEVSFHSNYNLEEQRLRFSAILLREASFQ
jgi:hypothetical protein